MPAIRPWTESQIAAFETLKAASDKRAEAAADRAGFTGGVQWKTVKGRDYLIHWQFDPVTGARRFDSLGPRSPKTEAWHRRFLDERDGARRRLDRLDDELRKRSADAKAKKIGHAPVAVGDVLRAVAAAPDLRDHAVLAGSYALLAYETEARCTIPGELLALPDARPDLDLLVHDEADVDAIERLLGGLDSAYRREGPGGQRFAGPVTIDCFTHANIAAIGEQIYGAWRQEEFLDAVRTAPIESYLVDRSGAIAPTRVLSIASSATLIALRAESDPFRNADERALDRNRAAIVAEIAENVAGTPGCDEEAPKFIF
jgi:hypothetical protein